MTLLYKPAGRFALRADTAAHSCFIAVNGGPHGLADLLHEHVATSLHEVERKGAMQRIEIQVKQGVGQNAYEETSHHKCKEQVVLGRWALGLSLGRMGRWAHTPDQESELHLIGRAAYVQIPLSTREHQSTRKKLNWH